MKASVVTAEYDPEAETFTFKGPSGSELGSVHVAGPWGSKTIIRLQSAVDEGLANKIGERIVVALQPGEVCTSICRPAHKLPGTRYNLGFRIPLDQDAPLSGRPWWHRGECVGDRPGEDKLNGVRAFTVGPPSITAIPLAGFIAPVLAGSMAGVTKSVKAQARKLDPSTRGRVIGLTMMGHTRMDVLDIESTVYHLGGVVSKVVVVWNGPAPAPEIDGCEVIQNTWTNHYANARNLGVDRLVAAGVDWVLHLDPDERNVDGLAIREMASQGDVGAWLFRFLNMRPNHRNSDADHSTSVRMVRVVPGMQMEGRVHEHWDEHLKVLSGRSLTLEAAPFTMTNSGLQEQDVLQKKVEYYAELLHQECTDNPVNGNAWYALGIQYQTDDHMDEALECYENADRIAEGKSPTVSFGIMQWHLKRALTHLVAALQHEGDSPRAREGHRLRQALARAVPTHDPDTSPVPFRSVPWGYRG